MLSGCQGKESISIEDRICPQCGAEVEIFSVDVSAICEQCGFEIYNDKLNCVQWCQYAEKCVGPEQYKQLKAVQAAQKARREAAMSQ